MAIVTHISWADGTWNPFVGCTRVGPGCDNCYAMFDAFMKSSNPKLPAYYGSGVATKTPSGIDWTGRVVRNSERVWQLPIRTTEPTTFFVNSMSDLFHEAISDAEIVEVFDIMHRCPQHRFQVLTKRPNRMVRLTQAGILRWTPNIWAGVTIENNKMVGRAGLLRKVPAHVRFISAEPLLSGLPDLDYDGIDWVIVGGESGSNARPMDPEWARDIRDKCIERTMTGATPTVFHFKQWGKFGSDGVARSKKTNGHRLDGAEWHGMPDKPVAKQHPADSIEQFRSVLSVERQAKHYQRIELGGTPARILLRSTIKETLGKVDKMTNTALCNHNLQMVGLDPQQTENVNIHAWALSDLMRKKEISKEKDGQLVYYSIPR